jgi:hypothetical protein
MYGGTTYAEVPYAALGGGIIVAACVHTNSQIIYDCIVGISQVHFVYIGHNVLNPSIGDITVPACDINSEVC